ncbi:MAG: NADPH-dependent 7-cyano-7-deazaguanine reductase QueF [Burkholderiales bacterium]|nr:NADPH-dependent 7-cyano-7-deazaguanine reductase QueF [Burkholderiales bacterium]
MATLRENLSAAPLGHATGHPERYDASLLFALPRAPQRAEIGITGALPFVGSDRWTAYEHTWLDLRGKPEIAIAVFDVPADSSFIIESKSMKLYLESFAQSRFADADAVAAIIAGDLSATAGQAVVVTLITPSAFGGLRIAVPDGESLDDLPIAIDRYEVDAALLAVARETASETLRTDLFRSLCPVTGAPDFASITIDYRGPRIERAALLRYLVSYRRHAAFHEHCVERIFVDLTTMCRCEALTVRARFTRRGGLDINPVRSNAGVAVSAEVRTPRQ